jgi:hypothetical protein
MARNLVSRAKAALTGKLSTGDITAGLEKTKSDLEARIPALEAAKATALDERRKALISGVEAGHAANRAREAEDDLAAVTDALAEVERRLADAIARRDAEEAQANREAVAKALEDDSKAIVAAAKAIEAAVGPVVRAHAQMQIVVSAKAAPQVMARPRLSRSRTSRPSAASSINGPMQCSRRRSGRASGADQRRTGAKPDRGPNGDGDPLARRTPTPRPRSEARRVTDRLNVSDLGRRWRCLGPARHHRRGEVRRRDPDPGKHGDDRGLRGARRRASRRRPRPAAYRSLREGGVEGDGPTV